VVIGTGGRVEHVGVAALVKALECEPVQEISGAELSTLPVKSLVDELETRATAPVEDCRYHLFTAVTANAGDAILLAQRCRGRSQPSCLAGEGLDVYAVTALVPGHLKPQDVIDEGQVIAAIDDGDVVTQRFR
jgi:hypothetical protein